LQLLGLLLYGLLMNRLYQQLRCLLHWLGLILNSRPAYPNAGYLPARKERGSAEHFHWLTDPALRIVAVPFANSHPVRFVEYQPSLLPDEP
jgi:hypothetical protein